MAERMHCEARILWAGRGCEQILDVVSVVEQNVSDAVSAYVISHHVVIIIMILSSCRVASQSFSEQPPRLTTFSLLRERIYCMFK